MGVLIKKTIPLEPKDYIILKVQFKQWPTIWIPTIIATKPNAGEGPHVRIANLFSVTGDGGLPAFWPNDRLSRSTSLTSHLES